MSNSALSMPIVGKTLSPGELLRAKREEYGWALSDVGRALRLSDKQVKAIEDDDYTSLPGKTYIMGYWRSYSQLLKISIDDSIQIHRAELGNGIKEFALDRPANDANGHEESSRKRAAAFFAALLLVALGAIWYWQNPEISVANWIENGMQSLRSATAPSPEPLGEIAKPEPIPDEEFAGGSNDGDSSLVASGNSAESASGTLVLPQASEVDSVLALPVPNFAGDQNSVEINTLGYSVIIAELPLSRRDLTYQIPEETEEQSARVAKSANSVAATKPKKPAQNTSAQTVATTVKKVTVQTPVAASNTGGDKRIVFNVAKESWIDVRDSTGERLIYRTVNRGEAISLKGSPPYSVFIGSAEGVTVQYQGSQVPFKAHESGLFARFEVGQ